MKSAGSYQLFSYPGTTCDVPAGPTNLFTLVKRSRKNLLWGVSDSDSSVPLIMKTECWLRIIFSSVST